MRNTIAALFLFFAPVAIFAAQSTMTNTYEITAGLGQAGASTVERMGPVCFPGDPCGPGRIQFHHDPMFLGPVCYPGDPCGWPQRTGMAGPVCFPGDPCGPQPGQLLKNVGFVMGRHVREGIRADGRRWTGPRLAISPVQSKT
jgi:hypothetical protein